MTALSKKHVLVIGDENEQINSIENSLRALGITVSAVACEVFTEALLAEQQIDLVVLNHLHTGATCESILKSLCTDSLTPLVPVFVMVEDDDEKIQNALSFGAADYITPAEDSDSVLQKLHTIFGQNDVYSDSPVIDISPIEAAVSTTGIRVYIVEDDPLLRNLLALRFNKSSFPYEFNIDGKNIVVGMLQFMPDVVILDLMLPGKSGFEVLEEIKAVEALKDIPVIIFSNRDGQDDRKRAKELGVSRFYVKAMTDLSELIETIESIT